MSAIVALFVLWREISRCAFWEFCNTIPPHTVLKSDVGDVRFVPQ
jgi:hypothetical protein